MSPEQTRLLARAGEAVAAARLLLEAGLFNDSASRSYYAMFYCASAMLLQLGARPKSHAGTISEFGRRCVMAGIASIEERDELILAERRRNAADYGTPQAEIDAHIAERLLETAGRWVERTPRQITEYARQSEPGGGKERSNGPDVER